MDKIILTHSLKTKDDSNVLVVGRCRTGKTNFFVEPNLLSLKDSVIVIGRDDDMLFEETANYRKEKLKQNIYTKKDFIPNGEELEFLGSQYTIYLTASPFYHEERIKLLHYSFRYIVDCIYYSYGNFVPEEPVTIIIDDLSLFPVYGDFLINPPYNVRIVATVQSIRDLLKIYGEAYTENILNSFKIKMFFHINDLSDAEYIVNNYNPQISKEEILQLKSNECLILGLKDKPVLAKDKIIHWFTYGKPQERGFRSLIKGIISKV